MKLLYALIIILCTKSISFGQTYIESIDVGIDIDNYLVFPYISYGATTRDGMRLEVGKLDYPTSTNVFFQETVRVRSSEFPWFPMVEDIGNYTKKTRGTVLFVFMGYEFNLTNRMSAQMMVGECSDEGWAMKSELAYCVLESKYGDSVNAKINVSASNIITETRVISFYGYSTKIYF